MKASEFLQAKRVLITRTEDRSKSLSDAIMAAGGMPILVPTVDIVDPKDLNPLLNVFNCLSDFDLAIFVSPNAVKKMQWHWQSYRKENYQDNLQLNKVLASSLKVIAIGTGTQEMLNRYAIAVTAMPAQDFSTEGLLALSILQKVSDKRIVIFCGEGGRTELAETLKQRGAEVTFAYTYCRRCPHLDLQTELNDWQKQGIDVVVGTSAASLYNLLEMVGESGACWLKQLPWLVVSERVADLTKMLGFTAVPIVAKNASNDAIFEALILHAMGDFKGENRGSSS